MKKSESIVRFVASEALVLTGVVLSMMHFRFGGVFMAFFWVPLQPWRNTMSQYTRPIVGREAIWTIAGTTIILGVIFFAPWAAQQFVHWPWPPWLGATGWALLALVPAYWLFSMLKRSAV